MTQAHNIEGYFSVLEEALANERMWESDAPATMQEMAQSLPEGLPVDKMTTEQRKRAGEDLARMAIVATAHAADDAAIVIRTMMLHYKDAAQK